jgi:hypothetical protein
MFWSTWKQYFKYKRQANQENEDEESVFEFTSEEENTLENKDDKRDPDSEFLFNIWKELLYKTAYLFSILL